MDAVLKSVGHNLDNQEFAMVSALSQQVDQMVSGDTAILTAGDIVFVPRGGARRLEVVGTSPAYCLEAIPTEHDS